MKNINPLYLAAGVAIIAAVLYVKKNGVQGVTYNLAGAAVDAVNGVISGTVVGVGKVVGIPETNVSQCDKDRRAGSKWDASFSCDAATFMKWIANGSPTTF